MDQCISQSSISPSPAASYSFSPTPVTRQTHSSTTPLMNALYLTQDQMQSYQQTNNVYFQQQQQQNQQQQLMHGQQNPHQLNFNANFTTTLNDQYMHAGCGGTTIGHEHTHLHLPIDLESLLVNASISENNSNNINNSSKIVVLSEEHQQQPLHGLTALDHSHSNAYSAITTPPLSGSSTSSSDSSTSAHNDDSTIAAERPNPTKNPMFSFQNKAFDLNNNYAAPSGVKPSLTATTASSSKKKIRNIFQSSSSSSSGSIGSSSSGDKASGSASTILLNRKHVPTQGGGEEVKGTMAASKQPQQRTLHAPSKIDEEEAPSLHAQRGNLMSNNSRTTSQSQSIRNLLNSKINYQQQKLQQQKREQEESQQRQHQQQQQQQSHLQMAMSLPAGTNFLSKLNEATNSR